MDRMVTFRRNPCIHTFLCVIVFKLYFMSWWNQALSVLYNNKKIAGIRILCLIFKQKRATQHSCVMAFTDLPIENCRQTFHTWYMVSQKVNKQWQSTANDGEQLMLVGNNTLRSVLQLVMLIAMALRSNFLYIITGMSLCIVYEGKVVSGLIFSNWLMISLDGEQYSGWRKANRLQLPSKGQRVCKPVYPRGSFEDIPKSVTKFCWAFHCYCTLNMVCINANCIFFYPALGGMYFAAAFLQQKYVVKIQLRKEFTLRWTSFILFCNTRHTSLSWYR